MVLKKITTGGADEPWAVAQGGVVSLMDILTQTQKGSTHAPKLPYWECFPCTYLKQESFFFLQGTLQLFYVNLSPELIKSETSNPSFPLPFKFNISVWFWHHELILERTLNLPILQLTRVGITGWKHPERAVQVRAWVLINLRLNRRTPNEWTTCTDADLVFAQTPSLF